MIEERSSGQTLVKIYQLNTVKTRAFLRAGGTLAGDSGGRNVAALVRSIELVGGLAELAPTSAAAPIVRVEYNGSTVQAMRAGYS